jgi:O-antigen/teichoic acid export membrane protein
MSADGSMSDAPGGVAAAARSAPQGEQNAGLAGRALKGGVLMVGSKLLLQVVTWASTLLVLRMLNPGDYGLIAAAMLVVSFAQLLTDGGLTRALIQKPDLEPRDNAVAFTFAVAMGAASFVVIWVLAGYLGERYGDPQFTPLMRVMGGYLLFQIFCIIPMAKLERELKYGWIAAISTAAAVSQALVTLALAWHGWGVWSLAAGILTGAAAAAVGLNLVAGWRPTLAAPDAAGRKLLAFGMTVAITNILWFIYHQADVAVISALLGPAQLGLYTVAMQLAMLPLDKFNVAINTISFSTFSRLQDDPERLRRWFLKLLSLRTVAAFPILAGLALVAEDLLPWLLGEKWRPMVPLFQILAPVGALMVVSNSFTPLFNAIGRPDLGLKYTAVSAALLPIAFLIGCKWGGLQGVCLAWLALYPPLLIGMLLLTGGASGVGFAASMKALATPALASAVMAAAVVATRSALPGDDNLWLRFAASVTVGAASFGAAVAALSWRQLWGDVKALRAMMAANKGAAA